MVGSLFFRVDVNGLGGAAAYGAPDILVQVRGWMRVEHGDPPVVVLVEDGRGTVDA